MAEDEKPDSALEEAMDWLLRLQDARHDPETTRQFEIWRSRSDANAHAWNTARRTWQLVGEVPPAHEHFWSKRAATTSRQRHLDHGIETSIARRRNRTSWAAGAAVAAFVGIFLAVSGPSILLRVEADYLTATAEIRTVTLDDGTVVTLGAASAIASDRDRNARRVRLLAGEAFFDVAHDASRPFVVDAGGVDVTVLGTAFNVQLSTTVTTVELARGAVGVAYEQAGRNEDATLAPGEMIAVDRHTGAVVKGMIAPEDIAAWRSGQLFVTDATIGSVVEQVRRYHPAWIAIPDEGLATQRVTGLYDLSDPDRALRALVQPYGGHVREVSPYLRVLSRF